MDDVKFTVYTVPSDPDMEIELYIQYNGKWVQQLGCIQIAEEEEPPVALRLKKSQAQDLMNRLWAAGLRPV